MLYSGLVSISFRDVDAYELIKWCRQANLQSIEWGADSHILPNNYDYAKGIADAMQENNLFTSAYGSYIRCGTLDTQDFLNHLKTAKILGSETIRVWSGELDFENADDAYKRQVIRVLKEYCLMAADAGLSITSEFHCRTLTNCADNYLWMREQVNAPNYLTGWQCEIDQPMSKRLADLKKIQNYLTNVHIFHWNPGRERQELEIAEDEFHNYIQFLTTLNGDRALSIEFVKNNSKEQFFNDAETLKKWIKN